MQNKSIVIVLSVLAALTAVLLAVNLTGFGAPKAAVPVYVSASGEAAAEDTVAVYGQGKVSILPDQATITFGYQNENADPKAAQDDNRAKMERIVSAVKAQGIDDAGIQTVSYRVNQNYDSKRFVVCNMMQVKTGDISMTSKIMKAAYDAGANEFWDVQFDIVKRQQAYTDALHLAIVRAREKADKLAADGGRKVTGVVTIEEGTVSNSYWYSSPYTNYVPAQSSSSGGYTDGGISSGEMEISAIVNVTYRLN
jgi:uncharacterized protein YggE